MFVIQPTFANCRAVQAGSLPAAAINPQGEIHAQASALDGRSGHHWRRLHNELDCECNAGLAVGAAAIDHRYEHDRRRAVPPLPAPLEQPLGLRLSRPWLALVRSPLARVALALT